MTQSMSSPFVRSVMLRHFKTVILIALVAAIAVIPHAYNMFEYPYYENDEGTYMAQAWSLFTTGELAPYTYWYDHAPGGWIQIGLWTELTQGFDTFGFSINSGRVLMLVFHVLSSLLLLGIGWKMFHNELPGLIAMLIFSFSPLGIYFQRRVLLDNIMTFWMLLSLYLIMGTKRTLVHYIGSAVAFSIAFLSKESIIYLLPAMLIIVFVNVRNYRNKFPLFLWIALMGLLIAYYPLYAVLKGELFPTGTLFGGTAEHVSLLETLSYQNGREGGSFLDYGSAFMMNLRGWMGDFGLYADPALIITGIGATFMTAILSIRTAQLRPIVLLSLCYWAFLIRGGVVIEFYIVPLIPLLALCIASIIVLGLRLIYRSLPQPILRVTSSAVLLSAVALPFVAVYQSKGAIYTSNPTSGSNAERQQWN